uniref:Secreted protein n=1 Tax=Panagrellus redivivus TaxID=6233 RepID=A0A7E4VRT3_PANRE
MAYGTHYYNYQIGVIFAILIGALLVLGIVVAGIYFACVVNMRGDKNKAAAPLPRRPDYGQPPYSSLNNPPVVQPDYRGTNTSTTPTPYNNAALVQPYNNDLAGSARIRTVQPEYSYQQGPMTWATMSPVHEAPYPMSPAPVPAPAPGGGNYHISSV